MSGIKFLCLVLSISLENSIITPGISRNTEPSARKMDLIKHTDRSGPILYCIKPMAINPPIVVRELPQISGIALLKAMIIASLDSRLACSSLYLFNRIMA